MPEYAELHCHSTFSLQDGASTPEALVQEAASLGLAALALTDHDDLGGQMRVARAAEAAGMRALHGAEVTLEDESHLTLLVESERGWRNLSALLTESRRASPRGLPRLPWEALFTHSDGLIALSGCPRGRIPGLLRQERYREARELAGTLADVFGDRFYVELWDHRTREEASLAADLLDLGRALDLPGVVTNDVHYATLEQRRVHDLLMSLQAGVSLAEAHGKGWLRPSGEWRLKSPREMAERWRTLPEALLRTLEVAERCTFTLADLRPAPPAFPLPDGYACEDALLAELAWRGLAERLPEATDRHRRQLAHELSVIAATGMAAHFLICWDLCRYAREQGFLCQGRGSAANSLVVYALRISNVDPVSAGLLFERFLSLERPEPPDIDIDFPSDAGGGSPQREAVLQYVYRRYGRAHAALVATHIEWKGRSAIRDACRGLEIPAAAADHLAKQCSGWTSCTDAADWLVEQDGAVLRSAGLDPAAPKARALISLVRGLEGLVRQRGQHPGGFVLSREPLGQIVPIEPAAMADRTVLQWDKDCVADAGLPKFDLLGLGMLRLLADCTRMLKETRGLDLDLGRLPLDDAAVYAQVREADTVGLFQIESRAQANFLPRLRPTCFYDLVISVGAIRPGPTMGGQVKEMLARKRGEIPMEYPHPSLEPILKRTYGVALFQEQLMQCAVAVSGCTPGEADQLRRAMGRKKTRLEMGPVVDRIERGMRERGVAPEAAEKVLTWLEACASYTFPESHAISFALLAYASAYLRHHYAPEYLAAALNAQPMGFYSASTLIHDARAHGVEVRPVDLEWSEWDSTLEPGAGAHPVAVRLGVRQVRGLGPRAKERLRSALETRRFDGVRDLVRRSGLGERELRALAAAGVLSSWVPGGPREAVRAVLAERRMQTTGGPLAPVARPSTHLPAMEPVERTLAAHQTIGVDLDGHPIRHLRGWLSQRDVVSIAELKERGRHGERMTTAGLVIVRQRPGTAKGFTFLGLEDETGRLDVIITPALYEAERATIRGHGILAVRGRVGREDGVVNLKAEAFFPLALADAREVVASHDFR